jgi:hypothetical protein
MGILAAAAAMLSGPREGGARDAGECDGDLFAAGGRAGDYRDAVLQAL